MQGSSLQEILAKVQQDDLEIAAKKAEASRAAQKLARQQAGMGLSASELMEQLSAGEEDQSAAEQEALVLHKKETPDAPKRTANGHFPAPPK